MCPAPDGPGGAITSARGHVETGEPLDPRAQETVTVPSDRIRRMLVRLGVPAVAALALTACGATPQSALDPQGPFAERPDDLFQIVFWIAVVIFVLDQGLIIVAVVRFRDRGGDDLPEQIHGDTRLEIVWTIIPALILAVIAVPTVQLIFELDARPEEALTVEVIGHRWWWEFEYPAEALGTDEGIVTANELVIPTGRPVTLEMTAGDPGDSLQRAVIHSFWVPKLAGKQDAVPGRTTRLNLQTDEPGRYLGQCAEYCGLSHVNMRQRVVAKEPAAFDRWVQQQVQPAPEPEGQRAQRGRDIFMTSACASCHTIDGTEAQGQEGPDLTHLMSRREFAGATLDLYRRDDRGNFTDEPHVENLRAWIRDPGELKPMRPDFGVGMPDTGLTDSEVDAVVEYLVQLE